MGGKLWFLNQFSNLPLISGKAWSGNSACEELDGKFCCWFQCCILPFKVGNCLISENFTKLCLSRFNGKFTFRQQSVVIYHPIWAKIFFVKSRNSKFCGKFRLWVNSDNLPLNLGNSKIWCFSLPRLDGKFCFCFQCHNLPLKMGKNIFFGNFMKLWLPVINGKFIF